MTLLKPKNIMPYKLFGIIGKPLQHSLSPKIQNRLFQQHKLPYIYLPFCLEEKHLKNLREVMRLCDIWGLNVTAPYKIKVLRYLDNLDKSAKEAGATNTIVRRGDKLIGYNTDGAGWWQSMKENTNFNPKGSFAIIIGAGGAARTVRAELKKRGANRIVFCRRPLKQSKLKSLFAKADLLVNATPAGQKGNPSLNLPLRSLPKHCWVMDLVYNPKKTPLLKQAQKLKLRTLGGYPMLIHQAMFSFKLWTR